MQKSMNVIFATVLLGGSGLCQQVVAPTPEAVGDARGENTSGYNVMNSFETGYRFRAAGGNIGRYRSDINYGNGIRLLGSRLTVNSKEGHGGLFDEIVLVTQGLGNDPYEFANLRIQKNKLYRYDLQWRENDYYNPALAISNGQHFLNTQRYLQDHDLTLFPQSNFKFFVGYSRNEQTGPALSTIQTFDSRGNEFPLFENVRRQQSEYRLGGEADFLGFRLNVLHGWVDFKEDSAFGLNGTPKGNNPANQTQLTSFQRSEPYHGESPYWRLSLVRDQKWWSVNARYNYVAGRRAFVMDELGIGTDRFTRPRNLQTLVFGSGNRPSSSGSVTLSVFPTGKLTVSNHTAFSNTRMDGNNSLRQIDTGSVSDVVIDFRYLGIRSITNLTDVNYSAAKWLGLYGGYQFTNRRLQTIEGLAIADFSDRQLYEQENNLHTGLVGIRLRPVKPFTITLDGEVGRADKPIYPISEKDYHAVRARAQYKHKGLMLAAWTRTNYNFNSVSLFAHSAKSRQYAFDASWGAKGWLSFDAGYSKLHLDTATGIAYFASGSLVDNQRSLYVSNIHTGTLGVRIGIRKRADLFVGYTIVRDAGDGRATPGTPGSSFRLPSMDPVGQAIPTFYLAQTFPVSYQAPLARLSIALGKKVRWNVGYQYYGYHEDFLQLTNQNYRAHTGYTSVLWSF